MLASRPLRIATFALVLFVLFPVVAGRVARSVEGHPLELADGALALIAAVVGWWGRGLLRATRAGPARNADALAAVDAAPSPVDDLEAQALAAGTAGEAYEDGATDGADRVAGTPAPHPDASDAR